MKIYKILDEVMFYKILDEMKIYKILDEVMFYKILDEMKIYKILDLMLTCKATSKSLSLMSDQMRWL